MAVVSEGDRPIGLETPCLTIGVLDEARLQELLGALLDDRLSGLEARIRALATRERDVRLSERAPVLLCERELASLLGLHPRTIRRLECNQEVPQSVQVGGSKRWRLQEIEEWLADLSTSRRR